MTTAIKHTPNLTETEKAYLAGFFDGEGCVSITKQRTGKSISPSYNLRLIVSQSGTNGFDLLSFWCNRTGLGVVFEKHARKPSHNTPFMWIVCSNEALALLDTLLPYLNLKKIEAELAISFQSGKELITWAAGNAYGGAGNKGGLSTDILETREAIYRQLSDMKGTSSKRGRKPAMTA